MDAYIKYLGDINDCYTRLGKKIPSKETKVELEKFFGRTDTKFLINKLSSDSRIYFKLVKSAGDTNRKIAEEQEIKKEIEEATKTAEVPKINVHKKNNSNPAGRRAAYRNN